MKKTTFLFTVAAAAGLLAVSPSAKAVSPELSLVTPLETFSFDVIAFNNTAAVAAYAVAPIDTTFGTTTTYPTAGLGAAPVTITSTESVGASLTVDTFTVTATNFAPTGYKIGSSSILGLEFDIAQDTTYADGVTSSTPVTGYTATGNTIYNTSTNLALTPTTMVAADNSTYSMYEGVSSGGAINSLKVHSFTYTISYPTVSLPAAPEPSSWAMCGVGLVGCAGVVFRRRRVA